MTPDKIPSRQRNGKMKRHPVMGACRLLSTSHSMHEKLRFDAFDACVTHRASVANKSMHMNFSIHTMDSAPEPAKKALAAVKGRFGMIPNLLGILAESPAALQGYLTVAEAFEGSSLSAVERHVVLLTVSQENGCEYCVAAHSMAARRQGLSTTAITAIRNGSPLADPRLEVLRQFTQAVVRQRGWAESAAERFLAAGFTRAQVLEVVLGVTQKTLSNYVNHLAHTPLDAMFEPEKWEKSAAPSAA